MPLPPLLLWLPRWQTSPESGLLRKPEWNLTGGVADWECGAAPKIWTTAHTLTSALSRMRGAKGLMGQGGAGSQRRNKSKFAAWLLQLRKLG